MAKFHNYFVLCPLIDQKSFLGVSPDKESDKVLVTLGRNVINKYRLTDQKQISGWTSKDHITSAVIYDKEQDSYVGIFNNNIIKIWKNDGDNLDKLKKYKFPINILKLIPRENKPSVLVFSNGNCAALPYALENRKTYESKSLIKDTESIVEVSCYTNSDGTDHICYITKHRKDNYEIINCPIREELGDLDRSKLHKVKVFRPDDVYVVGELICAEDKNPAVFILWSDSKMTVYDLTTRSFKTTGSVPWISTSARVSMAKMGKFHLILFSDNVDQDGAIIVGYNVTLGVGFCRYPMKMYTEGAKLYCINDRIILEASNHIGVLPYVLETKRNLSSLLGSHDVIEGDCTEIAEWEPPTKLVNKGVKEIEEYFKLGITERSMCAQVMVPLMEKKDVSKIIPLLKEFKDVPETVLVQLLNYSIKLLKPRDIDITDHTEFINFCSNEATKEEFQLLNLLFQISFSDALLIPYLRNGVSLDDSLFLLAYIAYLLVDSELPIDVDYESKLLDWCTLLVDAFYQQFLMTKDNKVTNALQRILTVVTDLVNQTTSIDKTMQILNKFLFAKESTYEESLSYAIEVMEI